MIFDIAGSKQLNTIYQFHQGEEASYSTVKKGKI